MLFQPTHIDGVWIVDAEPRGDDRGLFARAYCHDEFARQGLPFSIAQASLAYTHQAGTVRGLHFQQAPHWEQKLVRCVRGRALVVAVDLRRESATHRAVVGVELTCDNRRALYVGIGCAQGYQTLVDQTELLYQMSTPYLPAAAAGYRYDDPAFGIDWPLPVTMLSEKDRDWKPYPW